MSSRLPPPASIPASQALLSLYLHEASFPWKQSFRGIFGTLPPKDPRARDARTATSALTAGPGCKQARSAPHRQAGDELPARRGLEISDPRQQLHPGCCGSSVFLGGPLAARLVTQQGGFGPCVFHT